MSDASAPRFLRYVALGDSSTEGLDDPDGVGGFRGWANRLAERIATLQGSLLYANLGVRGRLTRQILQEQLAPAMAMRPDLATVFSGTNDVVGRRFNARALAADLELLQRPLVDGGATVVTFTLPDLTPVMPLARIVVDRVHALNQSLREVSARTGAILVDIALHPVASDPRLWSDDRLHANAVGHSRIAAALAHALDLPGSNDEWIQALPPAAPPTLLRRVAAEITWGGRYLVPWVWQRFQGRPSGDGPGPKRPILAELRP